MEEMVSRAPEPCQSRACFRELFALDESYRALAVFGEPFGELLLLGLAQQRRIDLAVVAAAIFAFLYSDNVGGTAISCHQIGAILGGKEGAQCIYAFEEKNQIIFRRANLSESRRNQLVPDALRT